METKTLNQAGIYQSLMMVQSFITTAKFLHGENGFSDSSHLYSLHLLTSNIFELLPKIYIWTKSKNIKNRENLIKEVAVYGHNLLEIYTNNPDIMKILEIKHICYCNNGNVSKYDFTFTDGVTMSIIDSESVRFGMFSKNQHLSFPTQNTELLLQKSEKLYCHVLKKYQRLTSKGGRGGI